MRTAVKLLAHRLIFCIAGGLAVIAGIITIISLFH
jgi:hypothetical protein